MISQAAVLATSTVGNSSTVMVLSNAGDGVGVSAIMAVSLPNGHALSARHARDARPRAGTVPSPARESRCFYWRHECCVSSPK